LSQLPVIAF